MLCRHVITEPVSQLFLVQPLLSVCLEVAECYLNCIEFYQRSDFICVLILQFMSLIHFVKPLSEIFLFRDLSEEIFGFPYLLLFDFPNA